MKKGREKERGKKEGWKKTEEGMIFIAGCGPLTACRQKKILIDKKKSFFPE